MRLEGSTRKMTLEAGILASLGLIAVAFGVFALDGTVGRARRSKRRQQPEPEPGTIPAARHQQVAVSSPR